jgi:hypothetical protein
VFTGLAIVADPPRRSPVMTRILTCFGMPASPLAARKRPMSSAGWICGESARKRPAKIPIH